MRGLGVLLWRLVKRNAMHYTPLYRLLEQLGVVYDDGVDQSKQVFGNHE
jgi:hypothetical protein